MRPLLPVFTLLCLTPLAGQQGDNKNHPNMQPVVPASEIPPAPVLPVEEALKTFALAEGFVIEPVAAEPLVEKPVCLDFDAAGRMWVCEMRGYMPDLDGTGENIPQGRISVLEDQDDDGRVDTRTVFLDNLLLPRAVAVFEEGVLFLDEHRLCWVKRDGLQPAGEPEVIDPKFCAGGNVEHKPNGLMPNLDNWLYVAKSDKRLRRVEGEWRIEPTDFRGQWGLSRDDWGRLYHNHNSAFLFGESLVPNLLLGNPAAGLKYRDSHPLGSNRTWPIRVTPGVNRAYLSRVNGYKEQTLDPETHKLINCTSACGPVVYRGTQFPPEWRGTAFVCESSVNLVKAIRIEETGGQLRGSHPLGEKEFLASTDERFRPVNAYTAPDGSLYVLDMYHGIIQHRTYMTTYLREQYASRGLDQPALGHGRIYRVRAEGRPRETKLDVSALSAPEIVGLLSHDNSWHRETAQRVLVQRRDPAALAPLEKLLQEGTPVAQVHALWTLEGMGALQAAHLRTVLRNTHPKVRQSALWATTTLTREALVQLESELCALVPTTPEMAPYVARVLGQLGTPPALQALAALVNQKPPARFAREAAVSGLRGHEEAFLPLASPADTELVGWLKAALKPAPLTPEGPALSGEELTSYERGRALYHGEAVCFSCHGPDGNGVEALGPPLAGSQWVTSQPEILISIMLHGMTGPVEVAGTTYHPAADMPGMGVNPDFTDAKMADVATFVRNAWGNRARAVKPAEVAAVRAATQDRAGRPYTAADFKPMAVPKPPPSDAR